MQVNPVNNYTNTKKSQRLKAARNGALITAGILTASAGLSWVTNPARMSQNINEYGGFKNYIKMYAVGLAVLSAIGAAANIVAATILQKVKPKNPPKAVN